MLEYMIQCSNPAYKRIARTGLDRLIHEKARTLNLWDSYLNDDENNKIIEEARKFLNNYKGKISEEEAIFKEIDNLGKKTEDEDYMGIGSDLHELLIEHPAFLGYFFLGENLFKPKRFEFPSSKHLAEAVTAYYFGEVYLKDNKKWVWRNKEFKNVIHQTMHGDLSVSQHDVSGNETKERDLFGVTEGFEVIKKENSCGGISAFQDFSGYLISLLKYAEHLGKAGIYEIKNWREVLKETGEVAGNYTEALGGFESEWVMDMALKLPLLSEKEIKMFPLQFSDQGSKFFPFIKDNKLLYFAESKDEGELLREDLNLTKGKKFVKCLEYCEEDLIPALKGTYKLYARVKGDMYTIMKIFNKDHT